MDALNVETMVRLKKHNHLLDNDMGLNKYVVLVTVFNMVGAALVLGLVAISAYWTSNAHQRQMEYKIEERVKSVI